MSWHSVSLVLSASLKDALWYLQPPHRQILHIFRHKPLFFWAVAQTLPDLSACQLSRYVTRWPKVPIRPIYLCHVSPSISIPIVFPAGAFTFFTPQFLNRFVCFFLGLPFTHYIINAVMKPNYVFETIKTKTEVDKSVFSTHNYLALSKHANWKGLITMLPCYMSYNKKWEHGLVLRYMTERRVKICFLSKVFLNIFIMACLSYELRSLFFNKKWGLPQGAITS